MCHRGMQSEEGKGRGRGRDGAGRGGDGSASCRLSSRQRREKQGKPTETVLLKPCGNRVKFRRETRGNGYAARDIFSFLRVRSRPEMEFFFHFHLFFFLDREILGPEGMTAVKAKTAESRLVIEGVTASPLCKASQVRRGKKKI